MPSNKAIWFFEEVNLYDILCPYKMAEHLKQHPLDRFNKNDFLFMEGDPVREIYLVTEGKVKIGFYDAEGNEQVIAFVGKGEILGERALFGESKFREFAQVVSNETKICRLRIEKARELARDYVPFSLTISKRFSDRVLRLERRLQILLFKDARHRLTEFLADLCRDAGKPYGTGLKIELDITQSDIASLIGVSRKTVSLLFTELENEGLLKFFGRKEIYVAKPEALA